MASVSYHAAFYLQWRCAVSQVRKWASHAASYCRLGSLMQSEIGGGLVERIFGALNPKFWINIQYLVISSVLILSLAIQLFSVLSTKAPPISGVDFSSGENC